MEQPPVREREVEEEFGNEIVIQNKTLENVQTLPSESKEFLVKKKSKNTPFQ